MAERLDPGGRPVRLGGDVVLRTPGLNGIASVHRPTQATLRDVEESSEELDEALRRQGAETERTILIDRPAATLTAPSGTLRTSTGELAIALTVPAPGEGWEQILLMKDEAGVVTWHFADAVDERSSTSRSTEARTYTVRLRVAETPKAATQRGFISAIGKKVLKVIAFKVLDAALGVVGDYFAGKWEERHRPYRCRTFTSADYAKPVAAAIDGDGWRKLGEDRALLLIHGTFSRAHGGFGRFPCDFVERLATHYGGRVFAFEHPTMSETPRQNVEWLLSRLPDGAPLDVDVICHSRGGLVARVLTEQMPALTAGSPRLNVHKVVFVATPNAGTVLADFDHLGDLVDSYTNLLNFVPDIGITDTLETLMTVIKMIAVGAANGLDGLTSMRPGGDFLKGLNSGGSSAATYYALASDYEPVDQGLRQWAEDQLADTIFRAGNDLIVPTDGVWSPNGSSLFPIEEREVFETSAGIAHSGFFAEPRATAKIAGWLGT